MKQGLLFFVLSVVASLAAFYLNPLKEHFGTAVTNVLIIAAIGAVILLVGFFVGYLRDRHSPFSVDSGSCSLFSLRVAIVLLALLISEYVVIHFFAPVVRSFILTETAYYLLLFTGGIMLSRWCYAKAYVSPSVGILVLVIFASWTFIRFVTSAAIKFELGPERWLFAMHDLSGQIAMLPLDVAVIFTGWYLFSRRRNTAT